MRSKEKTDGEFSEISTIQYTHSLGGKACGFIDGRVNLTILAAWLHFDFSEASHLDLQPLKLHNFDPCKVSAPLTKIHTDLRSAIRKKGI